MSADPIKQENIDTTSVEGLDAVFVEVDDQESIDTGSGADEGLKLSEASDKYGVTERTIQRWIKEGRLIAHKIDGQYGPEWRVTGENSSHDRNSGQGATGGRQTLDIDLTPTVDQLNDTVSSLTGLVESLSDKLDKASDGLQAASYRIGYLENQDQVLREQIKLLPDLQSQAEKARKLEEEQKAKELELTNLNSKVSQLEEKLSEALEKEELMAKMKEELEQLKAQQAEEEQQKANSGGFWKWFVGKR